MAEDLPPVGSTVNLRWNDRWVTAHVVGQRSEYHLSLVADGISPGRTFAVAHGPAGWMRLDEVPDLDWKQRHANDSETATEHELVMNAVANIAQNLGILKGSLPWLALLKIANVAAQVARAEALGFDPDLLRLTEDEANDEATRRAAELVLAGVPVRVIGP